MAKTSTVTIKGRNTLNIKFRFHALSRMFERKISETDVLEVLTTGKVIENYPTDQPYPSCLKLGFIKNRPLHIVTAEATDEATTVIITVYEPDLTRWEPGFEKRK